MWIVFFVYRLVFDHISEEDGIDPIALVIPFGFVESYYHQSSLHLFLIPGKPRREESFQPARTLLQSLPGAIERIVSIVVEVGGIEHISRQGGFLRVFSEHFDCRPARVMRIFRVYGNYVAITLFLNFLKTQERHMLAGILSFRRFKIRLYAGGIVFRIVLPIEQISNGSMLRVVGEACLMVTTQPKRSAGNHGEVIRVRRMIEVFEITEAGSLGCQFR